MFYKREISIQALSLYIFDVLCIFISFWAAHTFRFGLDEGWVLFIDHLPTISGSALILSTIFFSAGLYEFSTISSRWATYLVCIVSVALATAVIILVFYARFQLHLGRGILAIASIITLVTIMFTRDLYRQIIGNGFFRKPTLLVGDTDAARSILSLIKRHGDNQYRVLGILGTNSDTEAEDPFVEGVPVLGSMNRLREFVQAYSIETVVITASLAKEVEILSKLRPLRYAGIQLLDYASLHEELAQSIPIDHIDDEWLLHAALNSSRIHIRKIKRVLDLGLAIPALLISFIPALLTALLVRLDSKGPVFYRQRRTGFGGEVFTLIKFRTMRANAESESGAVWADHRDDRITRVGRFLRMSRLDEIPQLWNVIRGEMSFVGPRPERPEFVSSLQETIPFFQERLMVPPGITGWAQVRYPYAASTEAARQKLQFDLYYIKHMSLLLDFIILLRTFKTILVGMRHSESIADDFSDGASNPKLKLLAKNGDEEQSA